MSNLICYRCKNPNKTQSDFYGNGTKSLTGARGSNSGYCKDCQRQYNKEKRGLRKIEKQAKLEALSNERPKRHEVLSVFSEGNFKVTRLSASC